MITTPRYEDLPATDVPPTNVHGWLNRAAALTRWAMTPETNKSLRDMLVIQAKIALSQSKGTS